MNWCGVGTHLLHHFVLLVEELHLDVPADRKRLGELEEHETFFSPCVGWIGRVDLYLHLVDHKLGIWRREWRGRDVVN